MDRRKLKKKTRKRKGRKGIMEWKVRYRRADTRRCVKGAEELESEGRERQNCREEKRDG